MKWRRIAKELSKQPESGTYKAWKELIAEEGFYQCVYCAIHEGCFGGIRNFHIEHYRPKSKFKNLENDIRNLFYACAICNVFKGNDWPDEPKEDFSNPSYPDPSQVDYGDIFAINNGLGLVEGKFQASRYLVERLYLNRPQLIHERKISSLVEELGELNRFFKDKIGKIENRKDAEAKEILVRLSKLFIEISSLQSQLGKIRPYKETEIRRD
jgi:hypothetical protein